MKTTFARWFGLAVLLTAPAVGVAQEQEGYDQTQEEAAPEAAQETAEEPTPQPAEHAGHEMSAEHQAMMEAWMKAGQPGEPHQGLAESAGTWKATVKSYMEPGAEPMVSEGTFEREMIFGGRILQEKFTGDFMGNTFHGRSMVGYDNVTGRYWSTWIDDMSTGIMVQWGEWDEAAGGVVMRGEMPDPMTGAMIPARMVLTTPEEGREVMTMYETRDGQEVKTMEIVSVRQ